VGAEHRRSSDRHIDDSHNAAIDQPGVSDFDSEHQQGGLVLNLGSMLANGKVMFPEAVRLSLTDPAGYARELHFFDRRYPGIAGRVDDFIVAGAQPRRARRSPSKSCVHRKTSNA